jgi:hypothetical protein
MPWLQIPVLHMRPYPVRQGNLDFHRPHNAKVRLCGGCLRFFASLPHRKTDTVSIQPSIRTSNNSNHFLVMLRIFVQVSWSPKNEMSCMSFISWIADPNSISLLYSAIGVTVLISFCGANFVVKLADRTYPYFLAYLNGSQ